MPQNSGKKANQYSLDGLKTTVTNKIADTILNTFESPENKEPKKISNIKKHKNYRTGSTQDNIPIKGIRNGIICTSDNRYVSIIEVLPLDFYKKSYAEMLSIGNAFEDLYSNRPRKLQFKIMNDRTNPAQLIEYIKSKCVRRMTPEIKKYLDDYLMFIQDKGSNQSRYTRYFLIYEYDGAATNNMEVIEEWMMQRRNFIRRTLKACGNAILEYDNLDLQITEFLYYFFNRNTVNTESLEQRIERMQKDYAEYNKISNKKKNITLSDMIAQKGAKFISRTNMFSDGYYYGYIGIVGNTLPLDMPITWISSLFSYGTPVDIDVIQEKVPKQTASIAIGAYDNVLSKKANAKAEKNKEKAREYYKQYYSNENLKSRIKAGEDLYNVSIVITVRAYTERQLGTYIRTIEEELGKKDIKYDTCFDCVEEYYLMTMPLLYITRPFKRLFRNMLKSQLGSLYHYTEYRVYDPTGFVIGMDNNSIVAINLFNTQRFKNANVLVMGSVGSGKSFLLRMMLVRMFYSGINCYAILPKKGYEYKDSCAMTNGAYVFMGPDSKDCVNIGEIRPEKQLDVSEVGEDVNTKQVSLLAKKITNLGIWLQLLDPTHPIPNKLQNVINVKLVELYERFGITSDNDSIWADEKHTRLKLMPTIGDIHDCLMEDERLEDVCENMTPFISGTFKNFNGQTNIDINNPSIAFDCDEDQIGEAYLAAILYIAFDFCYDKVKDPNSNQSEIFFDEAWKMMQNEACADQVEKFIRLIRGYRGGCVIASQQPADFTKTGSHGRVVVDNCLTKIILSMEAGLDELYDVSPFITEDDIHAISRFEQGNALYISKSDKIRLKTIPTNSEYTILSDRTRKVNNAS